MLIASTVGPISTTLIPAARRVITSQLCRTPTLPPTRFRNNRTPVVFVPSEPAPAFTLPPPAPPPKGKIKRIRNPKQSRNGLAGPRTHDKPAPFADRRNAQRGGEIESFREYVTSSETDVGIEPSSLRVEDAIAERRVRKRRLIRRGQEIESLWDHLASSGEDTGRDYSLPTTSEVGNGIAEVSFRNRRSTARDWEIETFWEYVATSDVRSVGVGPSTIQVEDSSPDQIYHDYQYVEYDSSMTGFDLNAQTRDVLQDDSPVVVNIPSSHGVPPLLDFIDDCLDDLPSNLLRTMALSSSVAEVWEAYSELREYHQRQNESSNQPNIPFSHLHRVVRVISQNRPKTRTHFVRLLNVIQYINQCGGQIHLHEWNALIHNAGRGWRKTRVEDFQLAMDLHNDMVSHKAPGSTTALDNTPLRCKPVEPNIVTFTSLLSIAARTLHAPSIRRATALLHDADLQPNRITHLSMLRYFIFTHQISGVRTTMLKMKEQGLYLGLDGLNACIWAYAHAGDVNTVRYIYRVLRHNLWPEDDDGKEEVDVLMRRLSDEEAIEIDPRWVPNEVTFTEVVQALAYHGDLFAALSVFMDMLSAPKLEAGAPMTLDDDGDLLPVYSPTMAVFRAIFLGFARHGIPLDKDAQLRPELDLTLSLPPQGWTRWNHQNLLSLFNAFMRLPATEKPNRSIFYWIIIAFMKTSMHRPDIVRDVWNQMEARFGVSWGEDNRLQRLKHRIFSDEFLRPASSVQPQKRKARQNRRTAEIR